LKVSAPFNPFSGFRLPCASVYHEAIQDIALAAIVVVTISPGNTPEEDMLKGFRDFILRGNVVDLAVAVVIGTAFNAIVASLVGDVITPLIGALVGQPNFNNFALYVHGNPIGVGKFLTAIVHFLIVASVVYFGVVLPLNHMLAKLKKPAPDAPSTVKTCPECLSDIPLAAKRCAHCAQPVA
jgi:large conductance mechanosensitive channel